MTRCLAWIAIVGAAQIAACADSGDDSQRDSVSATQGESSAETDSGTSAGTDSGSGTASDSDTALPSTPSCEPLDAPLGNVVEVTADQAGQLQSIVSAASPGDTIALGDGQYDLSGSYLWLDKEGLTLRSASGDPSSVVLDAGYGGSETVTIAASNVTVAELTISRAPTHPIHVVTPSGGNLSGFRIYRVRVIDPGQQGIKLNPSEAGRFLDDGEIGCSTIVLTEAGRPHVDGCYTGGIDGHATRRISIHDNHIEGFWCEQGLSEHGIHLWNGIEDAVIERNRVVDCARGIGLGLLDDDASAVLYDAPAGIIRNNFIVATTASLFASESGFDAGIAIADRHAAVLHNSIYSSGAPFASIEWRFDNADVELAGNVVSHNLMERDGATATSSHNLSLAEAGLFAQDVFVSPSTGDLHLLPSASAAIDQGQILSGERCSQDIDGEPRDATPDLGADEINGES